MAVKTRRSYIRPSIVAAAILAVVFSHFAVSQFITFENERDSVITEEINKPPVKIRTEFEVKKPGAEISAKQAVEVSPVPEPENDNPAPKQPIVKQKAAGKKEAPRESRAQRLRRAEKLLTGV